MELCLYSDASADDKKKVAAGSFVITHRDTNIYSASLTLVYFPDTVYLEAKTMLFGIQAAKAFRCTSLVAFTDSLSLVEKLNRLSGKEPKEVKSVINAIGRYGSQLKKFEVYHVASAMVESVHNMARNRLNSIRDGYVSDII